MGTAVEVNTIQTGRFRAKKTILIYRKWKKKVQLIRSTVQIPNVHWEIKEDIGILTIDNFSQQTNRFLHEALEDFRTNGAKGIIIDLRDNSEGRCFNPVGCWIGFYKKDLFFELLDEMIRHQIVS